MMKQRLRSVLLVSAGMVLGMLLTLTWHTYGSLAQSGGCQTFPQTNHKVCGKFLTYWQQHGGLAQQGYPLSEEFVETSDLNGNPYTVQYFERAVFELHPEYAGTPYEVLLSQLGTYLGRSNYPQGFPAVSGQQPFYEIRNASPADLLKSYYNAINRKEYERAYSYFQGAPNPPADVAPPYAQFVQGYADTTSVTLAVGQAMIDAGAGNVYASIPVVLTAQHADNSTHVYAGCYFLHHVNPGISQNPLDALWSITKAQLSEVPASSSVDQLLARTCTP
jgi:hypothetical protein